MQNIDFKIELWKKRLLDLGKRNRLINFKETKRSNIAIKSPNLGNLFNLLVNEEKSLKFSSPSKTIFDENGEEQNILVIKGDIETNQTLGEQQRTLKSLRAKAKTSIEEQGINTLYLTLGMLKWKENGSLDIISSPIILVPVNLKIESINEPYILNLHDDEIVLNPSLVFKFENDFGVNLPEFNEHEDNVTKYILKITEIANHNEWQVTEEVHLALLSFLKINMYKDLDLNKDKIVSNPIIKSLTGNYSEIIQVPQELNNYDHDKNIRPIETFQVVDADSSQQDAILLSKKGISFVLQGPPGTGKSQTITNIIAEAIANGKKVLFVSEKMAALEVVKKRLKETTLEDFCLTLHSHKANKKDILRQLEKTLNIPKINVQNEILYKLTELEEKRKKLNEYQEELHIKCMPLNTSIYEINGRLAKLENIDDVVFSIENIENTDGDKLNKFKYLINEYAKTVGERSRDYSTNPWYCCNVPVVTHELRHNVDVVLTRLLPNFKSFLKTYDEIIKITGANLDYSIDNVKILFEILNLSIDSSLIPENWLESDVDELIGLSNKFTFKCKEYFDLKEQLRKRYGEDIFDISSYEFTSVIENEINNLHVYIDQVKYDTNKKVLSNADFIILECNKLKDILISCLNNSEAICQVLLFEKPENINTLIWLNELVGLIIENPKPSEKWFNEIQLEDALKILDDAKNHQTSLNESISFVKKLYDGKIVDIKYDEYLNKFNQDYKNTLKIISDFSKLNLYKKINKQSIDEFEINQKPILFNCKNIIELAIKSAKEITTLLDMKQVKTLDEMISLSKLIYSLNQNPHITESWFDSSKDSIIDKMILDIKSKQEQNNKLSEMILSKYNKAILNIDFKNIISRFNIEYVGLFKHAKNNYKQDKKNILSCSKEQNNKILDNEIISLLNNISNYKDNEQWLAENYEMAKELLGDLYFENLTNWEAVEKSRENFKSIKNYFANLQLPSSLKKVLLDCNYECINEEYNNLKESTLNQVSDLLCEIMGRDIKTNNLDEIFSIINDVYNKVTELKNDYDFIYDFKLNKDETAEIADVIHVINEIKNINYCKKWFKEKHYLLGEYLGANYIGEKTNFDNVNKSINIVNRINQLFVNNKSNKTVTKELIMALKNSNYPYDNIIVYQWDIRKLVELKVSERLDSMLNIKDNIDNNLNDILKTIDIIINTVTIAKSEHEKITKLSKEKLQFDIVMQDLALLNKAQKIEKIFLDNEKDLKERFSYNYIGINTDWIAIIKNLEHAKVFIIACEKYSLSEKFMLAVCRDKKMIVKAKKYLESLSNSKSLIDDDISWFFSLFDNTSELYTTNIYIVYDKIANCLNLALLDDWIDFVSIRKQCKESGLSDFIEKVEELEIQTDSISNVFLKRFYKLWLDVTISKYPAVFSFRSRNQQAVIDDFNNLDKMQLEIARLRIRERLIAKLPDMNVTTSSLEEIGILKRELSKQRNIMPLRRLFKAIPNLLTTLKPCLMMSPLSVSLYLQADGYKFDTIIFDEASQICTEDAIGAIMRGKQIIIAGDRYQLPPTSFFNATYSDNDFDAYDEDYYDDLNAFDSILDEAANAIPERTLRWHYRSRHENLIAFSNARIYKNELTTFPSYIDNKNNLGVEYLYVENGVYDRGARKSNIIEARRVAELVFEHFDNFPERSLGVVSFSESQQQAIETAIRQKRLANPSYENFFDEDKEAEFFVKNLENVQGDERDTIIFSIGYGKDANGVMYMNFGPLSRNGGYRRLNVAITRAKYNVKLVGSILPTDINIDKTNSEGVMMLKDYIEFALNGPSYFQNEIELNSSNKDDSTFEEAVCDFLTRNGYFVKTQVGCSDYRIDMAVKHPTLDGIFVLGIECDGLSYHSARTARERDRLRQSVLEDIGWTIYRIWSTDWVKDAKTESDKLLRAIEEAIFKYNKNIHTLSS